MDEKLSHNPLLDVITFPYLSPDAGQKFNSLVKEASVAPFTDTD